jgi:nicotinamidase-related amidase
MPTADRAATFDRVLALQLERTALLVVDMQRGFVALRARGVTSLVVTGTMTDICVLATVIGAFNREYRITVVEDAVATLWPEIQRATLDIVARAYGRVVSSKQVLDTLSTWT